MLTNEEKGFLLELQRDGRWISILAKLRRENVAPYKSGDKFEDWIFDSGRYRENVQLLEILSQGVS